MLLRILRYLQKMFPFFPAQIATFGSFALTYLVVARIFVPKSIQWTELLLGGVSMVLLNLKLRICDELKDYKSDLANFPDRPLVTGEVLLTDLQRLLVWVAGALWLLQIPFWNRLPVLGMFSVVMGFSFLMYRWFFAETRIRASLPLAFVTHHPVVFLFQGYVLSFFLSDFSELKRTPVATFVWLAGIALAGTAWEFSRKIRGTLEETAYTTYSKIWGPRVAVILLALVLLASFCFSFFPLGLASDFPEMGFRIWHLVWILPATSVAAVCVLMVVFLRNPEKAPPFRKWVEGYSLCLLAAVLVTGLLSGRSS